MTERRFTDREVARIFDRATASESDAEGDVAGGGRGLSLTQLQEIGREVGIPEDRITRAVAELGRGGPSPVRGLLGADTRQREIRSVPGRLDEAAVAELVRVMDDRVPDQGTVTEALGSVRWSSSDRFISRQLAVEPGEDETILRVEERYTGRLRLITQATPALYGGIFALALGAEGAGLAGVFIAVILMLAGWLLGRTLWGFMAGRSGARTHALADELAGVASRLAAPGSEAGDGETE